MTEVDTSADPQQIVCTGEEPGADKWNHAFGTWEADEFGIESDEPTGQGERLYVKRSLYDQACAERDALKAEVERLKIMVRQMHGMSLCVTSAPEVLGQWVERIDEVAINGPQPEYADYEHYSPK